eukprot:CAMPEP_0170189758 /NCGR_PEP_ID=MMETSP0040_2-20121228/47621_1 /TAXON_ID=641309 /ORGANISM="Lotharella oceanica, Strain CCMP622" /LENGTH=64 /DNA_ID=CAMNT_0010437413 /DNA_START=111 /DNA_END=305 /DNA_ORIENTATION=+
MCVQASVIDACLLGFRVAVPWDCTWASNPTAADKARKVLISHGAYIVPDEACVYLGEGPNVADT